MPSYVCVMRYESSLIIFVVGMLVIEISGTLVLVLGFSVVILTDDRVGENIWSQFVVELLFGLDFVRCADGTV